MPILTGGIGTIIGIIGIFASLYALEMRHALESTLSSVIAQASTVGIAVFVSCTLTVLICSRLFNEERYTVVRRSIEIRSNALGSDVPEDDVVDGRTLKYIERYRPSEELVVCIHGLGLDAEDFRPFLNEGRYHAVALTLFGFNVEERDDERYRPISLATHAELASYAIKNIWSEYPGKRLVLVGFSLGADLLMLLSEKWVLRPEEALEAHAALLLDPNVNRSSTNISSAIAQLKPEHPLNELRRVMEEANNLIEFRNMSSYLYKITAKNLHQIRRYAEEIVEYWRDDASYDQFLNGIGAVTRFATRVAAVFSFHYEGHFNSALRVARVRGMDTDVLECAQCDHFELMTPEFLNDKLQELLN